MRSASGTRHQARRRRAANSRLLDVFLQILRADFGAINISLAIHRDAFRSAGAALRIWVRDESRYLTVARTSDSDAAMTAGIVAVRALFVIRFRISDVEHIVFVDGQSARAAELFPRRDELTFLVENLDAVVAAIGDEIAFLVNPSRENEARRIALARLPPFPIA